MPPSEKSEDDDRGAFGSVFLPAVKQFYEPIPRAALRIASSRANL